MPENHCRGGVQRDRYPFTRTGVPFNAASVRNIRERYGLKTRWAQLREAGKLTTPEVASLLGIGLNTARYWANDGRLRGKPCSKGVRARWLFDPIDEQPPSIRQLIAARDTKGPRQGTISDSATGRGAV